MDLSKNYVYMSSVVFTYIGENVILFQLMAAGENGASGAHVQRVVNKENNQEHVNVIHQLHSTVERNVMARQRKIKYATRTSPAQVSYEFRQTGHYRVPLSF